MPLKAPFANWKMTKLSTQAGLSSVKHGKILTMVKGYGANLTTDKQIECDASLMESTGAFGAVGAIRGRNALAEGFIDTELLSGIKNPVTAARVVLERARDGRKALLGRVPPL